MQEMLAPHVRSTGHTPSHLRPPPRKGSRKGADAESIAPSTGVLHAAPEAIRAGDKRGGKATEAADGAEGAEGGGEAGEGAEAEPAAPLQMRWFALLLIYAVMFVCQINQGGIDLFTVQIAKQAR